MAVADMFLKVDGVTGECSDTDHKGAIEVVSWSWGIQGSTDVTTGQAASKPRMTELRVVKRVDQSSPTLMLYVNNNKIVKTAKLTVRKAGSSPLEYFTIDLETVRVTSVNVDSDKSELVERVNLGFAKVTVTYKAQSPTGGVGSGDVTFQADAYGSR